jgi:hypothetical protein
MGLRMKMNEAGMNRVETPEGDETCPVSTEGWTRRVHFVREAWE